MDSKACLILALSRLGWGETTFGVHVARQLTAAGHKCSFVAAEGARPLLANSGYECDYLGMHMGGLARLLIESLMKERGVSAVVLADYLTCVGVLRDMGIDGRFLLSCGVPVVGVDTWSLACGARAIDLFAGKARQVPDWAGELAARLSPAPIACSGADPAACQFLPSSDGAVTGRTREHVRGVLGITAAEKVVLFCTAGWQQTTYGDADGDRLAAAVPDLLGRYCEQAGPGVHLVHVGMGAIPALRSRLADRYHWLGAVPQKEFDALLGSSDLLLSLNISAATIGKAIVRGIPVLVLNNSFASDGNGEFAESPPFLVTDWVADWLRRAAPVYPFWLWPLGFHSFLEPVLRGNEYLTAVETAECLDESGAVGKLRSLLYDRGTADDLSGRQAAYVRHISHLPTAAELLAPVLER